MLNSIELQALLIGWDVGGFSLLIVQVLTEAELKAQAISNPMTLS